MDVLIQDAGLIPLLYCVNIWAAHQGRAVYELSALGHTQALLVTPPR
jgi:hypothetical protein